MDLMCRYALEPNSPTSLLSNSEQLVLSIIGDGSDDLDASVKLGLSPATVSTVRRNLHRKLGLRHRGELVQLAARTGYVRFTPAGIMRPGYALLAAACRRRGKPKPENAAA
jgi:DNA-binding CsgD family transcriptional regulator